MMTSCVSKGILRISNMKMDSFVKIWYETAERHAVWIGPLPFMCNNPVLFTIALRRTARLCHVLKTECR